MNAHEKGIARAADEYDNCWHDSADEEISDEEAAGRIISAYLEASGMLLVPKEATKEMIVAGNDKIDECIDYWNYDSDSGYSVDSAAANRTWDAMIAAFPQPLQPKEGE